MKYLTLIRSTFGRLEPYGKEVQPSSQETCLLPQELPGGWFSWGAKAESLNVPRPEVPCFHKWSGEIVAEAVLTLTLSGCTEWTWVLCVLKRGFWKVSCLPSG